jgi:cardiolipin synthase
MALQTLVRGLAALLTLCALGTTGCSALPRQLAFEHEYAVRDPQFRRVMDHLFGAPPVDGNSIETLVDADHIVPSMLQAIAAAERTITLETYILWSDDVGRQIMDALIERAQAGVKVHLLIDDLGSQQLHDSDINTMQQAGVDVVRYNRIEKVLLLFNAGDVNHRTHRKLLVVDGRVGFTGGIGFAELWLADDESGEPWRENCYRIEGPVVAQLQAAFMDHWFESAGQLLDSDAYFPPLPPAGDITAQFILGSPRDNDVGIALMMMLAVTAAERFVDIATPYFVPDAVLSEALQDAVARGVRVRILVPGTHTDSKLARSASRARWTPLLEAGVEIHEYQPAMLHCKAMIVDRFWTSVGSANVDPRSWTLNEEGNLCVFGERFAEQQTELFERDLAQSRQIIEWEHKKRSLWDRMGEFFGSLFGPQL